MGRGSVEDRLAIRELLEASVAGVIRKDAELWGETWAEEAKWTLPSMDAPVVGKSSIKACFAEKMNSIQHIHMSAVPCDLTFEDTRARGKAYCYENIVTTDGVSRSIIGCYHDEYIRTHDEWLFSSRAYEVVGVH